MAEQWAQGSIKLPYVSAGERPERAAQVNELLFLSLTGTPSPQKAGATFSVTDKSTLEGTTELDFKVLRNDERVLSLEIRGEYCGAYCEQYTRAFNFDARTGRALQVNSLLSPRGLAYLEARMHKERARRFSRQLKQLKARAEPKDAQELEDLDERIALNESCLEEEKTAATDGSSARHYPMWLLPGAMLSFTSERCSNHAMRALDDVAEVTLKLTLAEVSGFVTDYGKQLLLGRGDAVNPNPSVFGNVLHGKIGAAPITIWLDSDPDSNSVTGLYFYDKYRKPIALSGTKQGVNLELTESGTDSGDALISLAPGAGGLSGTWSGHGKSLPIELRY